eukprot:g4220.t1
MERGNTRETTLASGDITDRLIVTLRRLIRRLRRRCSKLQDFLRREIKFRWRYGKPPPELLICATQSVRKTLHTEQQELRVVLAHLRAISIDTVKAISEWRATFETSEPPGHRQISRNASAPSLHCKSPPLRGPTELQETSQCSSVVCHSHKIAEKAYDHQNDHDTTDNITILSGGVEAQQPKEDETETQHHNDLGFRGRNDDPTFRSKTACTQDGDSGGGGGSGGEGSSSRSSPPTIFLWKGNNYLVKMAHDLDFLDNVGVAAPVSAWLGFSVRFNPFLIPPEGHDVCEILRRGHEERCKEIAARRRQRLQQQQRLGNTGNGHRRFSRSRSRTNSGANRQRGSCDRDRSASYAHGHGGQEQQNEIGRALSNNAEGDVITPEATGTSQHPQCQRVQRDAGSNSTENVAPLTETTPAIALPGGEEGGATFVTEGGISMADESLDSASTSVEPQLLRGLGNFEDEDIPRELSSGEEEEVEWNGGGCLTVPIVPDLPDKVRSKASAATETLCCEGAAEQKMESIASEILANAKRTQEILRKPEEEHPSRVEWLAERSFKNGLRGALVDRHVGATRLKRAGELQRVAEERMRNRAAHLLQTFFRDIKYRRKRDRQALSLKNRDRIARERRELSAAIMVQSTIRRCIAFGRVKRMRHRRRGQAQTLIARAARQRATRVRQKQAEEREREEENASALAMMRKRGSLRPDEAAKRVQAWLRGAICRQTTVAEMLRAKEELAPTKRVYAPGSKSAHLKAALDALREAHSVMQSTENDKGKQNQEVRRRPVGNTSPSHRTRNSTTDTRRTEGRPSPNADELRWEARVSERKHTPPRDSSAKN